MFNLIKYSNNYSKRSESLWKYYSSEPALNGNGTVIDFPTDNNDRALFKTKIKVASKVQFDGAKDVRTVGRVKYMSNFVENPLNVIY